MTNPKHPGGNHMMIKCSTKGNPPIWGLAISLFLAGCVGFSGFDEIDQSELQREAVWPDSAITPSYCPIVAQGYEGVTVLPEIGKGQACGARAPLEVTMLQGQDPVTFSTDAIINCVMLSQLGPILRRTGSAPGAGCLWRASHSCAGGCVLFLPLAQQSERGGALRAWPCQCS